MMEFRIHYRGGPGHVNEQATTGSITVTGEQVQISTWETLGSDRRFSWLVPLIVLLFFALIPFALFFGWISGSSPLPVWPPFALPWSFCFLFFIIIIGVIPLYRRRITLRHNDLTACHVYARELLLQTAAAQHVITTKTTADARALARAVEEGAPFTLPIQPGRESLLDSSGFNPSAPVTVAVDGSEVTLTGRAAPSPGYALAAVLAMLGGVFLYVPIIRLAFEAPPPDWAPVIMLPCFFGGILLFAVIMKHTRPLARTLALPDLRDIAVIHHFVTFLSPDAARGERRCTLLLPSPEEADALARRLRGEDHAPMTITVKSAGASQNEADRLRLRRPYTTDVRLRPGRVTLDADRVTFIGRTGLAQPWTWRLAAVLVALVTIALVPVFSRLAAPLPLDGRDLLLLSWIPAAMVALPAVYLPAQGLLSRLLDGRVTLPRTRLINPTRLGRELSCWIDGFTAIQQLILVFDTDSEAASFAAALAEVRVV